MEQAVRLYFAEEPPFGATGRRKSEFPDAFALLSLEALAAQQGKFLVCVSRDKGWAAFAARSEHLVCVDRLEEAIGFFNGALQSIADEIALSWREGKLEHLQKTVESAFEYRLDALDFLVTGHADLELEGEAFGGALQHVLRASIEKPNVIGADSGTVTFSIRLQALVGFEACFTFYVYNDVSDDYFDVGSQDEYVEKVLPFELSVTANRSTEDEISFVEVEVARDMFQVDFGYIRAFPDEDPTYEKY